MTLQHNTREYDGGNSRETVSSPSAQIMESRLLWQGGAMAVDKHEKGDSEQVVASRSLFVHQERNFTGFYYSIHRGQKWGHVRT